MILVESHAGDDHLAPVRDALLARGHEVFVLDGDDVPTQVGLTVEFEGSARPGGGPSMLLHTADGGNVDLSTCTAAWWRRPRSPRPDPAIADGDAATFAASECYEGLAGLRAVMPAAWVNDPVMEERANRKLWQLHVARCLGLTIPHTVATSDPARARAFAEVTGAAGTVYKTFLAMPSAWRETRLLREDDLGLLDSVRHAPVIFQELVPGDVDLRVTVVGDQVLLVAIRSAAAQYPLDYRLEADAVPMERTQLPEPFSRLLVRLTRKLGLAYAAIDLRRRPDGELVFFEANPSGAWLWVEERTGVPVTATFVAYLSDLDRGHRRPGARRSVCLPCEQNMPSGTEAALTPVRASAPDRTPGAGTRRRAARPVARPRRPTPA